MLKRFLAVSVAAGILCGQQKVEPERDPNRIVLDVSRVNLLFTVSDKKGRFVTDLKQDDFQVYEKKTEQKVLEFVAESDLPLRLGILIDTSNSIRERFKFQQETAAEFINSVVRPRQDRAMVVSYDSEVNLVTDLTDDVRALQKGLSGLRPGGGTSMFDAIYFACRDKLMQDQPRHKFRRAMIILGDGEDNNSRYTRDQALEMAQKADVVVYTISTNNSKIETDGDKILRYLAAETGGLNFVPFKSQELVQSFENISNELRHQYSILYRPEPSHNDGLFHPVSLRVKARKELVVRCRKGYYAPKF